MTPLQAHLVCAALTALDLVARAFRIQWLVRGLGHRLSFRQSFALNAYGEAGCALTPLRLGGEPARLFGLLEGRVPAPAAFVAISYEVLAAWPLVLGVGGVLAWRHAPEWWATIGPAVRRELILLWPWIVGIAFAAVALWILARRRAGGRRLVRRPVQRIRVYWRRMPWWPIAASAPLSLVNVVARTAILPVLALALADPPAVGPTALGSFGLLYSQLVRPLPSGVGAVDVGFLAGAAGDFGAAEATTLLWWRFYTTGVGVLLGVGLAVHRHGWRIVRGWLPGGRAAGEAPPA